MSTIFCFYNPSVTASRATSLYTREAHCHPIVQRKGVIHYTLPCKACEKEYEQKCSYSFCISAGKPALWKAPLGIPVVVAINMMDVVKKNGDKINTAELSCAFGCKVVEISALKGAGIVEAAEAVVDAAKNGKAVAMHTFSDTVEHALTHIEKTIVHNLPEEQQRWYAIKIFERDEKVLGQIKLDKAVLDRIEADIKAVEDALGDDAESIITNERYVYIGQIIKSCYKKKSEGKLSISDKIDKVVTNRFAALPIFAVVMFLIYYISISTVGAVATDWANDGLFGDGWHLFGIGTAAYEEAMGNAPLKTYSAAGRICALSRLEVRR